VKISELQVRLQPTTPPKVREKDKYLKAASKGISNTVEDYEKSHGYDINSIDDQGVCFAMHILVGKIMRKCKANEVPVVISLDV